MHYKQNFITKVVFRLDFNPIGKLQTEKQPDFGQAIRDKYPSVESKQTQQITFTAGGANTGIQQEIKGWIWEYRSQNKKRLVTVSAEHLAVEYDEKEFTDFREFLPEVEAVYAEFRRLYDPTEVSRIGLRYIDEIVLSEGNPLEWKGIISDELACAATAGLAKGMKLLRSMHQLQARHEDIAVVFNYGIYNPDHPNPVARRQFILDTDCYVAEAINAAVVMDKFQELNKVAEYMFESNIGDELRKIMGPTD